MPVELEQFRGNQEEFRSITLDEGDGNQYHLPEHPYYLRESTDLVLGPGPNGDLKIMFVTVPKVGEEEGSASTLTPRSCTAPDALGICREARGTGEMGYCGCMCWDGRWVKFCDAGYQKCGAYETCNCKGSPCTPGKETEVGYDPLSQLCNILGSMTLIGLCGYLRFRKQINAFVRDPIGWFRKKFTPHPEPGALTPGLEPA